MEVFRLPLLHILRLIELTGEGSCFVAVTVMTGLVLAQVVLRYVLRAPLNWAEEASIFLMIWMSFVGAGVAMRRGSHIAMTLIVEHLPIRLSRSLAWVSQLTVLAFLFLVVWQGWLLAGSAEGVRSPALGIPMKWAYLTIPLGACFMVTQLLATMLDPLLGNRSSAAEIE